MSHFGFFCPPLVGHLNPMQALADALVARGHSATFFGLAEMKEALTSSKVRFVPLGASTHPHGTLSSITRRLADPRGLKLFGILRDTATMTDMLCREAPVALRSYGVDTVVADQLEPAGGLVAAHLGLPFLSVANALLINREDAVPPPFTDWTYDPGPAGVRRNRGGYRVADLMMTGMNRVIARHAARFGLAGRRRMDDCLSSLAQVTQTVPGFDLPRLDPSPTLHACGPLRGPAEPAPSGLWNGPRPVVFASLGTLQGGRIDVFRCIAQACATLDLQLVIAHGGRLSVSAAESLPGNPTVRAFVPQRALLQHAVLAITNGGLNTVLDALTQAVPVIAIPIAFEQGAIAARLAFRGLGAAVPLNHLTPGRLQAEIATILDGPTYRTQARLVAQEIAAAGGVARAALVAERVASTARAVLPADVSEAA